METIKINSIDEVDKYIDQLKNIKVWVCHWACGKSYLARMDERVFDVDQYRSDLRLSGVKNYEQQTLQKFQEMLNIGKIIVVNYMPMTILNYCKKNKLSFVYIRVKNIKECLFRLKIRMSSSEMYEVVKFGFTTKVKNISKKNIVMKKCGYIPEYYLLPDDECNFRIILKRNEFLSDYIWKVFGHPQKYVQNSEFNSEKYQLVFIEQRCLFTHNNKISRFTKKVIKLLRNKVKIILISGKSFIEIKTILKKLGLSNKNQVVICNKGKIIADGNGKKIEEITDEPSVKKAVQVVYHLYNVKQENTVTIGKWSENIDVLDEVGCSVVIACYSNGQAKQLADYITDNREADGVARTLVKIFNLKVKQ